MEEVRSYWQVASISHFCNLFRKPFKLPSFEPEELEQAFLLDVPVPPKSHLLNLNLNEELNNQEKTNNDNISNNKDDPLRNNTDHDDNHSTNGLDTRASPSNDHQDALSNSVDPEQEEVKLDIQDNIIASSSHNNNNNNNNNNNDNNLQDDEDQSSSHPSPAPPSSTKSEYTPSIKFQLDNNNSTHNNHQQQQDNEADKQPEHLLVKLAIALLKPHFNTKLTQTNWENYLKRIIDANWVELEHHHSPFVEVTLNQDGVELIRYLVFNELTLSDKIDVIYALCDYRLWCDDAVEAIKDYPLEELRLENIGKDTKGYEYWYFSGTRLFRENRELSQELIHKKKRIKELQFDLIEYQKAAIIKEKAEKEAEKKRLEQEAAKKLAAEAREAKVNAKRQQEQEVQSNKRRKQATPSLPPRTGLRDRRTSTPANNNNTQTPKSSRKQKQAEEEPRETRTTRSRVAKSQQPQQQEEPDSVTPNPQSTSRSKGKNFKQSEKAKASQSSSPSLPKKSPEEECREELDSLTISAEDRAEAWHMECDSLEEWENFAVKFEKSKSTNEKYLTSYVNEYILPKIRAIYAKRAAEIRRKEKELLLSLTYSSRRVSTRIISRQKQEEEEERQAQLREAETRRKKAEAETRLRKELEREIRTRQNKFVNNGGYSSTCSEDGHVDHDAKNTRYNLRQPVAVSNGDEFDGIIHPDNLSDFYEAIELVIDTVRTSKHAWPFVNPVPDTEPGYYDLIKEPMDLLKIRTKIEFREYKSFIELEKDFQLLVNNCEQFNGPKNIYTKMVYKLWKSFRKNVRLYLERELSMNEYDTFLYPPAPPKEPIPHPKEPSPPPKEHSPPPREPLPPLPPPTKVHVYNTDDIKIAPSMPPQCTHILTDQQSSTHEPDLKPQHPTQQPQQIELPPPPQLTQSYQPVINLPLVNIPQESPKQEIISQVKEEPLPTITNIEHASKQCEAPSHVVEDSIKDNLWPIYIDDLKEEIAPEPVMELEI